MRPMIRAATSFLHDLSSFLRQRGASLAGLALVACAFLPEAALGQTSNPVLFGNRDFEMDWALQPGAKMLRFRYHGATQRLRIDMLDGSEQTMHRDLAKGHIVVLVANGTKGAFAGKTAPIGAFQPEQIGGIRTIVGESCREFSAGGQTLCVTADGIPVMVDFGNGQGVAQRLLRETQPAALFDLPKGLKPKPLPGGAENSIPKGLF
ncbi:MAG: hypothetical protein O9342_04350 [Beijerinckiaceae bacterium]|nr:hypothetical protein [Beijerinckiaceae bacterium]